MSTTLGIDPWLLRLTLPMIDAVFLTWFFAASLWTLNALRRPVPPGSGFPPLWLPGMIVSELAPWLLVFRACVAAILVALGSPHSPVGYVGVAFFVASEAGLLPLMRRSLRSAKASGHSPRPLSLLSVIDRRPRAVHRHVRVPYWSDLTLDIHAARDATLAPTLIYVHPGSWMRGRPGRQSRPLFHDLASSGWVIMDIRYPLSPEATFPDHLVGVKRAIAWAKRQGRQYGVDPDRIVIAGASSGAHLASLAALTPKRLELQPGFEIEDTSVIGCVAYYGIYDLLLRSPTRFDWPFVARHVLKATIEEAPDLYRLGSPVEQVSVDSPPFLLVHGDFDSVVLAEESRNFAKALRAAGAKVDYHETVGAQHGFDAIASIRTRAISRMTAAWLRKTVEHAQLDLAQQQDIKPELPSA